MNHLIAKISGKGGGYSKVISGKVIFQIPDDLNSSRKYDSNYHLEDDEWFSIHGFSKKSFCLDIMRKKFVSAEYDQIRTGDFQRIDHLCAFQKGNFFFQKVGAKRFIQKRLLSLNRLTITEDEPLIVIENTPHAIYVQKTDTLHFKNLVLYPESSKV